MAKIMRGFSVAFKDGTYAISTMYNEVDENGKVTDLNKSESFYVMDEWIKGNIKAVEDFVKGRIENGN